MSSYPEGVSDADFEGPLVEKTITVSDELECARCGVPSVDVETDIAVWRDGVLVGLWTCPHCEFENDFASDSPEDYL